MSAFLFAHIDDGHRLYLFFSSFLYRIWVSEVCIVKTIGKAVVSVVRTGT